MALTFCSNKDTYIPIARIQELNKIVYLDTENKQYGDIPQRCSNGFAYMCPYCEKEMTTKDKLQHHISKLCKDRDLERKFFPTLQTTGELLQKLPQQTREVIFITGPPGCGKTYWANEYVKTYTKIFGGKVYLFTTHEKDPTIERDIKNYVIIGVTDKLLDEAFKLQDFKNSLVIFDDVETSKYPKATKYVLTLMEDISKNGRHYNINMAYVNQECRAGRITKKILSMFTGLVIFPNTGETYQMTRLLKEYCGFSKGRINTVMAIPTRWLYYSRVHPQYFIYENGVTVLGKELYLKKP